MKKILLALAIGAVAALGFGGVASAGTGANCAPLTTPVRWDGDLTFNAQLGACTNVDKVEFHNGPGGYDGIWDATIGTFHDSTWFGCLTGCTVQNVTGQFQPDRVVSYSVPAFCGGATHTISTYFYFRIHSSFSGTWGSWHQYGGTYYYNIVC